MIVRPPYMDCRLCIATYLGHTIKTDLPLRPLLIIHSGGLISGTLWIILWLYKMCHMEEVGEGCKIDISSLVIEFDLFLFLCFVKLEKRNVGR